jgi:hypothetical protein
MYEVFATSISTARNIVVSLTCTANFYAAYILFLLLLTEQNVQECDATKAK